MTTITRPSIYTYYKTKDEIILDLLARELLTWQEDLSKWIQRGAARSRDIFCREFVQNLLEHDKMLQHYCLLYSFLETNCRIEKLVEFKKLAVPVMGTVVKVLMTNFPEYTMEQAALVTEEIISYVLGVYPSTHLTPKQKEAVTLSETGYQPLDFAILCEAGILAFLKE